MEGWIMTTRERRIGLLLGIVALVGALAPAAQQPVDPNRALAEEQLKLARQAVSHLDRLYKGGEVPLSDARFALWERRQIEATRATGAGKAEIVAALEAHLKRLKDLERYAEAAHQKGQATLADVDEAKYRVLEAEMWLNQREGPVIAGRRGAGRRIDLFEGGP